MIKLEKMSYKQLELDLIAEWRNQSMISLRSSDLTAKGESQRKWVDSFGPSEKYYFIYSVNPSFPEDYRFYTILGYCGLDKIDQVNRTAEMGLLINPVHHKHGFGTEAVKKLLRMAFENFNLNCIFIEVLNSTDNYLFWSKQGFKSEGNLRQRHFKNNHYYGSTIASIIKEDWEREQRKNKIIGL